MESTSSKKEAELRKQAKIRKQIALLQAQLADTGESSTPEPPVHNSPKRKETSANVLAPATPTKKRKLSHTSPKRPTRQTLPVSSRTAGADLKQKAPRASTPTAPQQRHLHVPPAQSASGSSTVLQKLANVHRKKDDGREEPTAARTSSFADSPAVPVSSCDTSVPARDDRLALIEDLPLGPAEHTPPFDDPHFDKLEPNSGIRLSSRTIPHIDFQDYLRGRYYLSPSKLYSVIRLLPNKQGYDVPVSGDWLTIAVVAERGKVKYSQAPVGIGRDDSLKQEDKEDSLAHLDLEGPAKPTNAHPRKFAGKKKEEQPKPSGKRYVNMKLIDFGCRSSKSSATGGQSTIRGDAFLSLLLFESDGFDIVTRDNGTKDKIYKGGSRGAYEKLSKLKEGAVVALLNPKILKPYTRSSDAPHPTDNILAITPESDSSIAVIGHSQDLGMCNVVKKDGSVCGSWCDKRIGDVCEWHVQHAIQQKRAGRAEFAVGTSGMSTAPKRKPKYDPDRQWGLKPDIEGGAGAGATYVVSGHVISGSNNDARTAFVSESLGRDAQAKAARKASAQDTERALQELLRRDKQGTKALVTAREFARKMMDGGEVGKGKGKGKEKAGDATTDDESGSDKEDRATKPPKRDAYSATLIKQLGFDPAAKDRKKTADSDIRNRLQALSAARSSKRDEELGPRPGKRSSCVMVPRAAPPSATEPEPRRPDSPLHLPDSDDELEAEERSVFGKTISSAGRREGLVNLDDSDSDLEIEPPR